MIAFDLRCSGGHNFEGWFKDLDSFNEQNAKGLITCPICKSTRVIRVLSPVAIKSSQSEEKGERESVSTDKELALSMIKYINDTFEDVGTSFTKEALKIHYGVGEKRDIRGSATVEEEQVLKDEGVRFFKIPFIKTKDDEN